MDERIPVIAVIATAVVLAFFITRKRELRRLHQERGYDAQDPNLDREAFLNTKAKFRAFNTKSRNYLEIARGILFAPMCALLALGFIWAGLPNRWDMLAIGTFFGAAAWFFTRNLLRAWRNR